jgi:hypothetical protein
MKKWQIAIETDRNNQTRHENISSLLPHNTQSKSHYLTLIFRGKNILRKIRGECLREAADYACVREFRVCEPFSFDYVMANIFACVRIQLCIN